MFSAPTSTAPAASNRRISGASRVAGARSRLINDPARVGSPAMSNRFFTANGIPPNGPAARPAPCRSTTSIARAAKTVVNAFNVLASIRAKLFATQLSATQLAEARAAPSPTALKRRTPVPDRPRRPTGTPPPRPPSAS